MASSLSPQGVWKLEIFKKCVQVIFMKRDKVSNSAFMVFAQFRKENKFVPNRYNKLATPTQIRIKLMPAKEYW